MNANELADELAFKHIAGDDSGAFSSKIITMLRQQQAEIEALKAAKIRAYNNGVEDGRKPDTNNEPVMWMYINKKTGITEIIKNKSRVDVPHLKEIPLYTHPVKDLEDIDINITWNENSMRDFGKDELAFARAILLKAQEK